MRHEIKGDKLVLTLDPEERAAFAEAAEEPGFDCDAAMHDLLEPLVCNSELEWVQPEWCGALTDAPILGITAEPQALFNAQSAEHHKLAGCWPDDSGTSRLWVQPVVAAWGWMDYAVRSLQRELLENGRAVLVGGQAE